MALFAPQIPVNDITTIETSEGGANDLLHSDLVPALVSARAFLAPDASQ